jgi:hypothetical protein
MGDLFKRLQRSYGTKAALCFLKCDVRRYALPHELLHAEVDVERNLGFHVAPADITTSKHQVEEPANAGPNEWHDQRAGAVRMSLTVSA